jgi:hypothetical protein
MPARRVVKHEVPRQGPLVLDMQVGSKIIAVGVQLGIRGGRSPVECVWAEQVTDSGEPPARWVIHVLMTGDYVRPELEHIGTHVTQDAGGAAYVAHFYQERMR